YEEIFRNICENTLEPKESMFEVDMAYLYGSKENAGSIGTITTGVKIVKHSTLFNCNPKVLTNYTAYQKYADKDLRREVSIADYWLEGVDFSKKPIDKKQSNQWSCAKWRRDWHKTYPSNWSLSDVNYVILRYADVLLMRAEILNELDGPTAEAVELVNQVRRRGYGLDMNQLSELADVPDTVKTDKDTFFKFLTDEYAREFLGEGRRRFHLIRWNLLKDKIQETDQWFDTNYKTLHSLKNYLPGDCFVAGKSELWPLPYREIKENQGSLGPNNPGYE
ncbi:MAG: RagB/SusD family nutrient uptake outer membrane protein, partial [Bacteroidales bacterium]